MKKTVSFLLTAVICYLTVFTLFPVHGEEKIFDSVVRLHILANSDSEEDQTKKLKVRDAVLAVTSPLLQDCRDVNDAKEVLEENADLIRETSEKTLLSLGCGDEVTVELGKESYPERSYDGICFPSGTYLSMQIRIGNAEGKNWWCCLFPPLCLGTAKVSTDQAEDAFVSVGLTPSQYKIITENDRPIYRVRFRILELFS